MTDLWLTARVGRGTSVTRELCDRYAAAGVLALIFDPPYRTMTLDGARAFLNDLARTVGPA